MKTQLRAGGGDVKAPATGQPRSQMIPKRIVRLNNNKTTVGHMGVTYPTIIPAPVSDGRKQDKKMRPS